MAAVCPKETAESSPSLFQNGNLVFQAHHVGWIVATLFTIVATVASFWLVDKHLQWYTNKREQRYIVRLLFMVPIYAFISLASYFWWSHATPLLLIRDAYESTVLTAFFYLLLVYLSPDPDEQRRIFVKHGLSRQADLEATRRGEKLKKWVFPLNFIAWKPADGLLFLQAMKWGVLQYCVLRPTTTLAAVVLEYMGLYCEESWGLGWGHIYIVVIVSLSVTVAMYCLIQLYVSVAPLLKPHKPLLKLFAIKAVVFLTFWQATFLSVLSMLGVVKDTKYMTSEDINIGIGALLETFEMMLFAFLHIKAFSYKPYRPVPNSKDADAEPIRTPRLKSLGHALDFRETLRELWNGCIYLYDKMRGKPPKLDRPFVQASQYEEVFGRSRPSNVKPAKDLPEIPESMEPMFIEHGGAEKRWLVIREGSDDLEVQIERELARRGYGSHIPGRGHIKPVPEESANPDHSRKRSWWRTIYNRISQSGEEGLDSPGPSRGNRRKSKTRRDSDVNRALLAEYHGPTHPHISEGLPVSYGSGFVDSVLETPPPLSLLAPYRHGPHQNAQQHKYQLVEPPPSSPPVPPPLVSPSHHGAAGSSNPRMMEDQLTSRRSHRRESALHESVLPPSKHGRHRQGRPQGPLYLRHPSKPRHSQRTVPSGRIEPRGPHHLFTGDQHDQSSTLVQPSLSNESPQQLEAGRQLYDP